MSGSDDQTLAFYAANAAAYAAHSRSNTSRLDTFLAELPGSATVLDLGCGAGRDTAHMLARGYVAVAVDGSPELAAEAERLTGHPVRVMLFEELSETEAYDGVWASASLLHVPADALPGALARVHRALRPSGVFWASFKAGTAAGRDAMGRYYNRPDEQGLTRAYFEAADWSSLAIASHDGGGYDDVPTTWLWAKARR